MRPQDPPYKKLSLKDKWPHVPFNPNGDPQFVTLKQVETVFSPEEITTLVNKALYALNYQKEHHQKRYQSIKEKEQPK